MCCYYVIQRRRALGGASEVGRGLICICNGFHPLPYCLREPHAIKNGPRSGDITSERSVTFELGSALDRALGMDMTSAHVLVSDFGTQRTQSLEVSGPLLLMACYCHRFERALCWRPAAPEIGPCLVVICSVAI